MKKIVVKNLKIIIQCTCCMFILLFVGCSPKKFNALTTTSSNTYQTSTISSDIDVPYLINDTLNSIDWIKFNPNASQISYHFTDFDKRYVQVKDPLLFKKSKELVINFTKIALGDFIFPLTNARIISNYGIRHGRQHSGIDLKTFPNDTIRATFSGIVRVSLRHGSYGNLIVIRHYNGLETVYSHNSKNLIHSGSRVRAGEPIALTGRTGRATTEHLHFEIRINGQHFDPKRIIDFSNHQLIPQSLCFTQRDNGRIRIEPHDAPIVSR